MCIRDSFEAVHTETGQKVAVKAIHEKLLSNLTAVQRFVAEARLMARVSPVSYTHLDVYKRQMMTRPSLAGPYQPQEAQMR